MRLTSILAALIIGGSTLAGAATTARAQSYETFYSFPGGKYGKEPVGGLTAFQGRLLGMTFLGGGFKCALGCGTVLSLSRTTGQAKVVYRFQDRAQERGDLVIVGGAAYGTSVSGPSNYGTVFSIDPHTHSEKIIYAFQGGSDGFAPIGKLLNVAGMFYGVTADGGSGKSGTVFSIDIASGTEKVVYAFQGHMDGSDPFGGLIQANGLLYGTTLYGAEQNQGTIFSVDPATGAETVLHSFGGHKVGSHPEGGLIKVGDKLYGTATGGGAFNQGTVFSLSLSTGEMRAVYSFKGGSDGAAPQFGLVDVHGTLYGTTPSGGSSGCINGCGTIFSIDLATKTETIVHAFQDPNSGDGYLPLSDLTNVGGALYGTTTQGGRYSQGTAFKVTLP